MWFLVSAQLSCHSTNVMFSPALRIGIVLWLFLKDSEESVLRDSELQPVSTFALLPDTCPGQLGIGGENQV